MKYCTHCGKQLFDEAVICPGCGCMTESQATTPEPAHVNSNVNTTALLTKLSERLRTSGIIWIVIAVVQIIIGLFGNVGVLIVGAVNIASAIGDMKYSKTVLEKPKGIVRKFEPLAMPIFTLVYNVLVGGVIGVVGSIYYFVALRGFVMENKTSFAEIEETVPMFYR